MHFALNLTDASLQVASKERDAGGGNSNKAVRPHQLRGHHEDLLAAVQRLKNDISVSRGVPLPSLGFQVSANRSARSSSLLLISLTVSYTEYVVYIAFGVIFEPQSCDRIPYDPVRA